jgi:hypothetical protein
VDGKRYMEVTDTTALFGAVRCLKRRLHMAINLLLNEEVS